MKSIIFIGILAILGCSDNNASTFPGEVFECKVINTYQVPELTECVVMAAAPSTFIRLCDTTNVVVRELDVPVGTECLEVIGCQSVKNTDPIVLTDKSCK